MDVDFLDVSIGWAKPIRFGRSAIAGELAAKLAELEQEMSARCGRKDDRIDELTRQNIKLERFVADRDARINDLACQNSKLMRDVADRDAAILQASKRIDHDAVRIRALEGIVDHLQARLAKKDTAISHWAFRVKQLEDELRLYRLANAELESRIGGLLESMACDYPHG